MTSKYKGIINNQNELLTCIANELAEANRLKRLEIEFLVIPAEIRDIANYKAFLEQVEADTA